MHSEQQVFILLYRLPFLFLLSKLFGLFYLIHERWRLLFCSSKNKKSMWSVFFVKIYPGVEDCQSLLLRFISVMIKFLWNHNNKWKVLTCQYPTWMENYKSKEFSGSIHTKEQSQKVVYRKYNFHLANNPLVKTWGRKY